MFEIGAITRNFRFSDLSEQMRRSLEEEMDYVYLPPDNSVPARERARRVHTMPILNQAHLRDVRTLYENRPYDRQVRIGHMPDNSRVLISARQQDRNTTEVVVTLENEARQARLRRGNLEVVTHRVIQREPETPKKANTRNRTSTPSTRATP